MKFWKRLKKFNRKYLNPAARLLLYPVIGLGFGLMMRLWNATIRVTYLTPDGKRPDAETLAGGRSIVYAFWHGRQFFLFRVLTKSVVLSSLSEAGELQKWVLKASHHVPVRGSSTRGAAAGLVNAIKKVKEGRNAAFAVDGPRGPVYKAKPGALQVAAKAGAVLWPVSVSFRSGILFRKLWDLYLLPLPFTRAFVSFGTPRTYEKRLDDARIEADLAWLDTELTRCTEEADAAASRKGAVGEKKWKI